MQNSVQIVQDFYYIDIVNQTTKGICYMKYGIYAWHKPSDDRTFCVGKYNPNAKTYQICATDYDKGIARIKQEIGKVGVLPEFEPDFCEVYDFDDQMFDKTHYDGYVRKTLIKHYGKSCNPEGEWIRLPAYVEDPIAVIKAACIATATGTKFQPECPYHFVLRKGSQDIAVDKIVNAERHSVTKFLLGAKCRFGKTFASYKAACEIGARTVLIMTFRPSDVRNAWREDLLSHRDFVDWQFYTQQEIDQFKICANNKVLFISFQKCKDLYKKNDELLRYLQQVKFDMLIIDEDQIGAHREDNRKLVKELNAKFTLVVTGTPELEILSNEFSDNYYRFDYVDEQKLKEYYKKTGDERYKDYGDMPSLEMYSLSISDMFSNTILNTKNGFSLSEFFKIKQNSDKFEHELHVKKFLDYLAATSNDASEELIETFAIFKSDKNLKHGLWKLSTVQQCKAMKKLLESHIDFCKYHIEILPEYDKTPDQIEQICNMHESTIWLTVVKNTVGVTVKSWTYTMSLYGSAESSLTSYIQFIFRAGSSNKNKDKFYTFDFCPNRVLKVVDMYAQARAVDNGDKTSYKEAVSTVLNYLAVFAYNGAANFDRLDANKFYKNIAQYTTDRSCRNLLLKSFSSIVSQFYNEVVDLKVENHNVTVTHNDVLTKIKKELVNRYNKKTKKQIDCIEASDEEFTEKFYQAFIDIFKFTKYIHDKIDNVEDLIDKIEIYKDCYESVYDFSTDFIDALIFVMRRNEKNFNIAIERFADLEFKFDKTNVPMQLADKMVHKLTVSNKNETVCDWCCKGPNLLLAVKNAYPNSTLYARINKNDLRTKLVLSKAIPEVKFVYVPTEGEKESMKFDCVVMNPPYDKSLHLQILAKALNYATEVVNISPIRWLQDPFAQEKHSELKRFENNICKKLNNVEIVNSREASDMFGINVYSDLGIYTAGCGFDYANFWKIGRAYNEIDIINKICNNTTVDKLNKYVINNVVSKGTYVLISGIAGGRGNKPIYKYNGIVHDGNVDNNIDFLTAWNTNPKHAAWQKQNYVCDSIKFNSITEAENFYNSYNTKTLTYVCKISCQQQHIQLQKLPFMQDYSKPWTDRDLCEFFNITGYISDTEAEPGSEWETILNSVK